MSAQDLTSYTRAGLAGGIMIDSYHRSQLRISRAAERGARRERVTQAAGPAATGPRSPGRRAATSAAAAHEGMPRWTTWLWSGVRHRSSVVPANSDASANC